MKARQLSYPIILFQLLIFTLSGYSYPVQNYDNDTLNINKLLSSGINFAKKKDFKKAQPAFTTALNSWQTHPDALLYLKIIRDSKQKTIKKKAAGNIFKAVFENYNAHYEKALKQIDKSRKKNKTYFPIYLIKGNILNNLENFEAAEIEYGKAIELAPKSPLPYLLSGLFYQKNDQPEKAIDDYSKAIELDPHSAICYYERGFVNCVQKNYLSAIKDFSGASKEYPEWGKSAIVNEAYFSRGVQRTHKKSYKRAVLDFNKAIEINPDYLDSYLNRGIAYRNLKSYRKAIKDFNTCIEKRKNFKDAYYHRGVTYYEQGKYKQANADLVKVLGFEPGNTKTRFKLAESYYKSGRYNKAITQFNKVLRQNSNYYWAYYWKGFACKSAHKNKQAVAAFKGFLSLAPKNYYKQIIIAETEIKKIQRGL